jgi:hypothetical protein
MRKVEAIITGYYGKRRDPGDQFSISDETVRGSWMRLLKGKDPEGKGPPFEQEAVEEEVLDEEEDGILPGPTPTPVPVQQPKTEGDDGNGHTTENASTATEVPTLESPADIATPQLLNQVSNAIIATLTDDQKTKSGLPKKSTLQPYFKQDIDQGVFLAFVNQPA